MKRITEIVISNYRAFYNEEDKPDKYKISLTKGENLLVYGENGSGKSSFFRAIQDFFQSAYDNTLQIENNLFTTGEPDLPRAEIKLKFSERNEETGNWDLIENLTFNRDDPNAFDSPILKDASRAFLSYRDILKTYFLDINSENSPNLFDLFINTLLSQITDATTNEQVIQKLTSITTAIDSIEAALAELLNKHDDDDPTKTLRETRGKKQLKEDLIGKIQDEVDTFNTGISAIIEGLIEDVNLYLNDPFDTNIKISLKNTDEYLSINNEQAKPILNKALYFNINFFEEEIAGKTYQIFLNEARLSALAICFFLAAAKKDRPEENIIKLLFLDDIFIGLDTNNRLPLLEIIKRDFTNYQIIITTYDRYWYEVARNFFGHTWKNIELYTGAKYERQREAGRDEEILKFELPVLIHELIEPYDNARRYFEAFDYYSSGNNLRKVLEEILDDIVPGTYLISSKDLESSILQLKEYYKDCGCDDLLSEVLFRDLRIFKDILLNPSSHFDLKSPLYRSEIKKAFKTIDLLKRLPKIERILLLPMGEYLNYSNEPAGYYANYILIENCYRINLNGHPARITDPKHKLIVWSRNGVEYIKKDGTVYDVESRFTLTNLQLNLSERAVRIKDFLDLHETPNWKREFRTRNNRSLEELLGAE